MWWTESLVVIWAKIRFTFLFSTKILSVSPSDLTVSFFMQPARNTIKNNNSPLIAAVLMVLFFSSELMVGAACQMTFRLFSLFQNS
jgi:hypothetical protein